VAVPPKFRPCWKTGDRSRYPPPGYAGPASGWGEWSESRCSRWRAECAAPCIRRQPSTQQMRKQETRPWRTSCNPEARRCRRPYRTGAEPSFPIFPNRRDLSRSFGCGDLAGVINCFEANGFCGQEGCRPRGAASTASSCTGYLVPCGAELIVSRCGHEPPVMLSGGRHRNPCAHRFPTRIDLRLVGMA
jgi:hypothetical protein